MQCHFYDDYFTETLMVAGYDFGGVYECYIKPKGKVSELNPSQSGCSGLKSGITGISFKNETYFGGGLRNTTLTGVVQI